MAYTLLPKILISPQTKSLLSVYSVMLCLCSRSISETWLFCGIRIDGAANPSLQPLLRGRVRPRSPQEDSEIPTGSERQEKRHSLTFSFLGEAQ